MIRSWLVLHLLQQGLGRGLELGSEPQAEGHNSIRKVSQVRYLSCLVRVLGSRFNGFRLHA